MSAYLDFEHIRIGYKPEIIRLLFIGESPPAGGTFFYKGDSKLGRYTERAFVNTFGPGIGNGERFLDSFKGLGCYLEDLCHYPINHLSRQEKRQHRKENVDVLAERILAASPRSIVVVMKGIIRYVHQAAQQAGIGAIPIKDTHFPVRGRELQYVEELTHILNDCRLNGVISEYH